MRTKWLLLFAFLGACANAQTGRWDAVMNLQPGTAISVVRGHRDYCVLISATEEELACEPDEPRFFVRNPYIFDRKYVQQVRLEHPVGNTLVGTAAGVGLGVAIGSGGGSGSLTPGATEVVGGVFFGFLGGFIGRHVRLVHGSVIYVR